MTEKLNAELERRLKILENPAEQVKTTMPQAGPGLSSWASYCP
jgi:hypothetical protein